MKGQIEGCKDLKMVFKMNWYLSISVPFKAVFHSQRSSERNLVHSESVAVHPKARKGREKRTTTLESDRIITILQ